MKCHEMHDKRGISFSITLIAFLTFLVMVCNFSSPTYGKSVKYRNAKPDEKNNSKRHYVVTEEEIQDTYFIPQQQQYPVVPQYSVPVMTQVISPPQTQTEPKKPTPKHGNEHKEEHVLFKPPKAGNGNDEPAANGHDETGENGKNKGDSKSGFSVNTNRNVQGKINSEMNEILENSDNGKNKESASTTMTEMFSGTAKKVKAYRNVGCYKDSSPRAVPSLEGSDPILTGYYKNRQNAVEECAKVAKTRGYQVFTIQNGGFCSSGPMAHRTFQIYGPASNCNSGRGGIWASDVYIFNVYAYEITVHTGIEQKSSTDAKVSVALYGVMGSSRHIPLRSYPSTYDPFQSGKVDKFTVYTVPLGDLTRVHTCIDNTGPSPEWYLEKISIKDPRNKIYVFPCNCWLKGGMKGSITERNLLPAVMISPEPFKYIGCFKHPKVKDIFHGAQDYKILDGRPSTATQPYKNTKPTNKDYVIEMCAQNAYSKDYMFFGIHNGEQCLSSGVFQDVFHKYGEAFDCSKTGRGGKQSIAVYTFIDKEPSSMQTNVPLD